MLYFNKLQQISNTTPISNSLNIVVLGDSISAGTSDGVGSAAAGTLFELQGISLQEITTDIFGANTGSWMPKMAETINTLSGKTVNISTNGFGGSEFAPYLDNNNWSTLGNKYAPMKTDADYLVTSTGQAVDCFIIILGINDARGTTSIAQVETDAISLVTRLNTDYNNPEILFVQIGKTTTGVTTRVLDVRNIISNGVDGLVETFSNVSLGASLVGYADALYFDGLHLTQAGNDQLGTELGTYINSNI